jgi:hypothetical protein
LPVVLPIQIDLDGTVQELVEREKSQTEVRHRRHVHTGHRDLLYALL